MRGIADVHLHTRYSGVGKLGPIRFPESIVKPEDVVNHARGLGFDVVCITDHDSIQGAMLASDYVRDLDGIEVIVGEEVTTSEGEVIGLFLNERVPPGLTAAETIDLIREQDGLVLAPHPFSLHVPALGNRLFELDVDAIETVNAGHLDNYANRKAKDVARSGRWASVAGSDAHSLPMMGYAHTTFDGNTADDLRRSILARTTGSVGDHFPLEKAIHWSVAVALQSDILILRSILGMIREADIRDPIVHRIDLMDSGQKFLALLGSSIYFIPPVPYICGIISQKVLRKLEKQETLGVAGSKDSFKYL